MRRSVRIAVGFFVPVLLIVGCGEKTVIPTKQDQPVPEVAAPAGGGAPTKAGGGKKESAMPNKVAD
jgi:hypothetical protein